MFTVAESHVVSSTLAQVKSNQDNKKVRTRKIVNISVTSIYRKNEFDVHANHLLSRQLMTFIFGSEMVSSMYAFENEYLRPVILDARFIPSLNLFNDAGSCEEKGEQNERNRL